MEMFKLVYQNAVTTEGLKVEVYENQVYNVMLNIEDEKLLRSMYMVSILILLK